MVSVNIYLCRHNVYAYTLGIINYNRQASNTPHSSTKAKSNITYCYRNIVKIQESYDFFGFYSKKVMTFLECWSNYS